MRIVSIFIWIIIGAAILWFFTLNLNQNVDIYLYTKVYPDINLVIVIFITLFLGVIIGALAFSTQIIKAKAQTISIRKGIKQLQTENETLKEKLGTKIKELEKAENSDDKHQLSVDGAS